MFAASFVRTVGPPEGGWGVGGRPLLIVWVPHWSLVSASALPPLLWLARAGRRRLIVRRRRKRGRCLACGYDLTGNVSGACPECGRTT